MRQKNYKNHSNISNVKKDVILNGQIYLGEYEERRIQSLLDENGVTVIGRGAFRDVVASVIKLPRTVKRVATNAFLNCQIESLVVEGSETVIERNAFLNCKTANIFFDDGVIKKINQIDEEKNYLRYIGFINCNTIIRRIKNLQQEVKGNEEQGER